MVNRHADVDIYRSYVCVEKKEYCLDLIINLLDLFGAYKSPEI